MHGKKKQMGSYLSHTLKISPGIANFPARIPPGKNHLNAGIMCSVTVSQEDKSNHIFLNTIVPSKIRSSKMINSKD